MEEQQLEKIPLSNEYNIAISYSNIQRKHGLPVIVSGIVCPTTLLKELHEKDLPRKATLVRRVDKYFNLKTAFDDVSDYLTGYEIIIPKKVYEYPKDIEDVYYFMLNVLMKGHIHQLTDKIGSIVLHGIEKYDKETNTMQKIPASENFLEKLLKFVKNSDSIRILESSDDDRLLTTASILASSEYYRQRSTNRRFVTDEIKKNPNNYFQILKIGWNSPPVESYCDFNVGPPSIIVRKSDPKNVDHVYLQSGMRLSIAPLARFCKGTQHNKIISPCASHSLENPFGKQMNDSGREFCWDCGNLEGFDCSLCFYRKPLCDGYKVKCGNYDFAGNICCGLFGLYVTRFGTHLKVGTSFLPNIIGRLLEQGAGHALIMYPFQGILLTYELEKYIKEYLQTRISELTKYGISKVYVRAPPSEDKLRYFLNNNENNDKKLLQSVKTILEDLIISIDNYELDLKQTNFNIHDFRSNFITPPENLHEKYTQSVSFGSIRGNVVGYRGNFVFLDSGNLIDTKKLQGYVVKGVV